MRRLCFALLLWAPASLDAQAPRLYLANQDDATVSVVDLATKQVVETIDLQALGFGPNAKPHHAQVDPDGNHWYLTAIGAGKVFKFDRSNHLVGSVDLEVPGLLTIVPGKDLLVVGKSMSAVNPPKRIALIRRSDMKLLDEIEVFFPRPHALVADPRGEYVFVASLGVNQLASIRLEDGHSELVDYDGPQQTFTQFAISPDGHWLAVTSQLANQVLIYDTSNPAKPVLAKTLAMVARFRESDKTTPIVLMGYYNPIHSYGVDEFSRDAQASGVDGLIIVDLPPEEDLELRSPAKAAGLDLIRLATPTTDAKRLPAVLANTSGFVYYVSITGITGTAAPDATAVRAQVKRIKAATLLPVAVGFGVNTPEQARAISKGADGVVVGSTLVNAIRDTLGAGGRATGETVPRVLGLVARLASGLKAA